MLRRIGVLASLAVFATMFAGVTSAHAATSVGCVFTGLAGNLTPPLPGAVADQAAGGIPDIEIGTYDYSGPAVCSGILGGRPITPLDDVTITSQGRYENVVCGTGWANDLNGAGTTITSVSAGVTVTDVGYEIPFVGGNGPLYIGPPHRSTAPTSTGEPITGTLTGEGAVHITPVSGDCVTSDVSEFSVAGSFLANGI